MQTWFIGPWELSTATACLPDSPTAGRVLFLDSLAKGAALPWHRKKLVLVLSALRHFRDELRTAGYEVHHRAAASYAEGIRDWLADHPDDTVIVQAPAEHGIGASMAELAATDPRVRIVPDRRFIVSREWFASWATDRKLFRMEDFYRAQRRRHGVLLDDAGEPAGGAWNHDAKNRKTAAALRRHGLPPAPIAFPPDDVTRRVIALVDSMPGKWGSTDGFAYPVTRTQALAAFEDFVEHRLPSFGPFEDAMLAGESVLYHSRLSVAMNVGLLHPMEMVRRVESAWHDGAVPIASAEGFIRQILGWREYVNGIYWDRGPAYRDVNYFGFTRPLPQCFWEPGQTDLACVADVLRTVERHAWAHHIPRLMVLCNFAVLTGVDPGALSDWFWAAFADAMEWVELPNVVGMGTYGDGGLMASKPYVASANYLNRMGDHCGGCRYDPGARTGALACPFNYLYWTFLDDVRQRDLDVGERMRMPLANLARIPAAELAAMHAARTAFLESLAPDATGWQFHHDQG